MILPPAPRRAAAACTPGLHNIIHSLIQGMYDTGDICLVHYTDSGPVCGFPCCADFPDDVYHNVLYRGVCL